MVTEKTVALRKCAGYFATFATICNIGVSVNRTGGDGACAIASKPEPLALESQRNHCSWWRPEQEKRKKSDQLVLSPCTADSSDIKVHSKLCTFMSVSMGPFMHVTLESLY
jgi:hypothetical protein